MKEIIDGTSNTILIVDADDEHAVVWTKPQDLPYSPERPLAGLVGHHEGGFQALFADGSVRFITEKINPRTLQALMTRNGGEVLEAF